MQDTRQTVFKDVLKRLRVKRGWSQEDLAKASGVHRVQIAKIETGKAPSPSWSTVKKLAKALGESLDVFADEEELT